MAQQFISDAGVLIVPGAYPQVTVQTSVSGLATTGVIAIIGEADAGPDYSLEADLNANSFGPDALADVVAKYKTGSLVDAFRGAAVPANSPDIIGSPSAFILVKTNPSTKASGILPKIGGGTYATLADKSYGALGNLIYFTVTSKTAEVRPAPGSFTLISPVGTINGEVRINGGAVETFSIAAAALPSTVQATLNGLSGLTASGGVDRAILTVTGNIAIVASGNSITLSYDSTWATTPTVGDALMISSTSAVKGGSNQNVGAYVITSANTNTIVATKLSDAAKSGAVPGTITPPVTVGSQAVASTTADARAFSPIALSLTSSVVVDGLGKSIEVNELNTGTDLLSRTLYTLSTTPVSWVSKSGAAQLLTSAAEYAVNLNVNRQFDNVQETDSAGGQIALQLGYTGTTCSAVVSPTTLVLTAVGGAGAGTFTLALKNYPTLNDLVAYIGSLPGFIAKVGSAAVGQTSSLALDEGTFACATTWGNYTMRLKIDAVKFFTAVSSSAVVQLNIPAAQALAGLPDVTALPVYLTGGAKGGTSDAIFQAAVDALQAVKCNFIVPAFSRNASADIADGLTDSSSSYDLATVTSYCRTHVTAMSTLKRRRNRQAFLSVRDTFANAKELASSIANARCSMTFQDVKDVGSTGVQQFQPWMAAAKAAGMQAAGFYRAIVNKGINISSAVQAAGDYKPLLDSNEEDALTAGLLPIKIPDGGGFAWVSDQTTYTADDNFVYNSIQAMYAQDTIALTTAQRMEKAFVGQSVADVSANVAMGALESIMADYLRLKLIAKSDDAPKGFKNAKIQISGPVMKVYAEVKLAGAIYFIPINFLVSQVQQSASQ